MGRRGLAGSLVAVFAALALFALAPSAGAFVYWANQRGDTIGRAASDGTGIEPNFIPTGVQPCGVAVDDRHVYWANSGASTIGRATLNGTDVDPDFITGASQPCGPSLNTASGTIYWANQGTGTIGKATLKGTQVNPSFIPSTETQSPSWTTDFGGEVYWTNYSGGSVSRASDVDGSGAEVFIPVHDAFEPLGVVLVPTLGDPAIFWANNGWRTVGGANVSSGGPTDIDTAFFDDTGPICGLATDGTNLYWGGDTSVARAALGLMTVDEQFIPGANGACGVAVDQDQAEASLTPTSFNFGALLISGPSASQDFTLSNSSDTTIALQADLVGMEGPNQDQYDVTGGTCAPSEVLDPGQSCTITVTFDPTSVGGKAARLRVNTNDPSGPVRAAVFGTGVASDQTIAPTSINFGAQLEHTLSAEHTVTFTNGPGASSSETIGVATVAGTDASQFQKLSDGCSGTTLAVGASCQISLAFAPSDAGDAEASLSIPSNNPATPATVALSGTGTQPDEDLSPGAVGFGDQAVGGQSATRSVTVANSADGTGPLQVGPVSLAGGGAAQFELVFDGCSGQSIVPGGDCKLGVRFNPTAAGSQAANLQVPTNATSSPASVSLNGNGLAVPMPIPTENTQCTRLRAKLKKTKSKRKRKALRRKLRQRGC